MFFLPRLVLVVMALPITQFQVAAGETVLGAYIFHRHGDRTSKEAPDPVLTDLGYYEVFTRGAFYHDRYISSSSPLQIAGISEDIVRLSQISVSSPPDTVIQNSAAGWLQGLYPPVGPLANETLRNGTTVDAPLSGYQLIPVSVLSSGSNSEDAAWLQGATGCEMAETSSNEYYSSAEYNDSLASTSNFYQSLTPLLDQMFTLSQISYKNAYAIFDYLNVALIHNSTAAFPPSNLLTDEVYRELLVLANDHEYNLAYNSSDPIRAVAGAVLAGQVLASLNETIASGGASKLSVQFGAYGTFLSYFGLAQLSAASPNFTGIPDYAASMVWELVTNSTSQGVPSPSEISVRFFFHNGTSSTSAQPTAYPLFGQSGALLSWSEFVSQTNEFAITSQQQWCQQCGNVTGVCAASSSSSPIASSTGISTAVGGVIGAFVTLGVVLGLEALVLVLGGFRLIRKRSGVRLGNASDKAS